MGSEKVLDLSQPICMQMSSRIQGKRPAVYLRYDEPNPSGGYIRIYPKGLRCDIFCYEIYDELPLVCIVAAATEKMLLNL
jgi:hypothetical protein